MSAPPAFADVLRARELVAGVARVTPLYGSETLSRLAGREVHLKAENLQRTGSFKIRGAYARLASLGAAERAAGVVAASAGNHGQAVAWAAREAGIPATVFMPQDAPMAKVDATRAYGAAVELGGEMFDEALAAALARAQATGATFVHAFEDPQVVAGQGTIGLELDEQLPAAGALALPVGGGGLAAGVALALRELRPSLRLVGVQAASCATFSGGAAGFTIADGIAVKRPGALTSALLRELLDDVVTVSDEEIGEAIVLLLERAKLVVEGAGAVGVAALLHGRLGGGSAPAAILLSGGNIDPTLLIGVMRAGLTRAGRYLVLRTRVPDRPGELLKLLSLVAAERVNVVSVEHRREGADVPLGETGVELTLVTRDAAHREALLAAIRGWGYPVDAPG